MGALPAIRCLGGDFDESLARLEAVEGLAVATGSPATIMRATIRWVAHRRRIEGGGALADPRITIDPAYGSILI